MTTPDTLKLRPATHDGAQLRVRKPVRGYLAPKGESVPRDSYWLRRLADGDVEEFDAPAAKAKK